MPKDLLSQKNLIEEFLNKEPHRLSAFSFVNIFTWQDFFEFECQVIDGSLCIFARHSLGCFLYLPPLGDRVSTQTIQECFRIMNLTNKGSGISRIENVTQEGLSLFSPQEFSFFKKSEEYIYRKEDIISLKGNKFKTKRSAYNHFCKNYRFEFLPYEEKMQQDCQRLFERWAKDRAQAHPGEIYIQMLEENQSVHPLTLKHYKALGLIGRVVRVDGEIKAYTFGFKLNNEMFCILFEIADLKVNGLAVYIFKEFCADKELKDFQWINAMDDFGLENIKKTKMSFHPCERIPSFVVSKKDLK